MEKKFIPESELIINPDGSVFHLHLLPEQLTDRVILVGDPGQMGLVATARWRNPGAAGRGSR